MIEMFARFASEDAGQDLIEYALLAGLISLVCIGAIGALGAALNTVYLGPLKDAVNGAGS